MLLGGDIGTYSLAREFHEAYGAVSVVVPAGPNGVIEHSVAIELAPSGSVTDDEDLLRHLLAVGERLTRSASRPLLLLGSLDLHVSFAARYRERLEPLYTIPYPDQETIEAASLKQNFYALCDRLGLAHPWTLAVDPTSGASQVPDDLPFPLIGKPSDSSAWVSAQFPGKQKVHEIPDRATLDQLLERLTTSGYVAPFILQERIPGGDEQMRLATFFVDQHSQVVFAGSGEVVVEEHSPKVIGNSAAIVTEPEQGILDAGRALLTELGWQGFAMLDAKLDPRDGQVKLFEMNPRLGRNHYYLTAAGANPVRFYVDTWLQSLQQTPAPSATDPAATEVRDGVEVLTASHLYTVLPHALLRRHAHGDSGKKALRLLKSRQVSNPLVYRAERHPKRWGYIAMSLVNQYRKFKAFPPQS